MRRLRIIFVLAVVAVALMSSPNAFADKDKGSPLMFPGESKGAGMAETWEIMCGGCNTPVNATCEGDVSFCLAACEAYCGGPCGVCQSLANYC